MPETDCRNSLRNCFSALQRAEIAEIQSALEDPRWATIVSVLFNEPKLLKYIPPPQAHRCQIGFSALQRAEIAEIVRRISLFALR